MPAPPVGENQGKLFYLAADGRTINTIHPDGSNIQRVLVVDKQPDEMVFNLIGEPSGTFLLYAVARRDGTDGWPRYFLVQRGRSAPLMRFASRPRWSPDGRRFVARSVAADGTPGSIYLYDTATGRGQMLGVRGAPDWFPDGKRLVYSDDNIFTLDLATGASAQLTKLPNAGEETWGVQESHVLPDGQNILFYGGQRKSVGASGNGQQWWWLPATGGTPQPFSDAGGNGVLGYELAPAAGLLAYTETAHASACLSEQHIVLASAAPGGGVAMDVPYPGGLRQSETDGIYVQGFSIAPAGDRLAFGLQPYHCANPGEAPQLGPQAIYVWSIVKANGPKTEMARKLVDGSSPVWIK